MKESVIITGGSGFIGQALIQKLLEQDYEIISLIHNTSLSIKHPNFREVRANISNIPETVDTLKYLKDIDNYNYRHFIHLAWHGTSKNRYDFISQNENVQNSINCVQIAKQVGCSNILIPGSIMEYEASQLLLNDLNENDLKTPMPAYSFAKLESHHKCREECIKQNINLLYPIISNAYGVGDTSNRFVCSTLNKILNNEPLKFSASTHIYDFIYIDDIANSIIAVMEKGIPFKNYILSDGTPRTLKEFILTMCKLGNYSNTIEFGKPIPYSFSRSLYDVTPLIEDTGYTPMITFEEGITKTLNWLKGE